MLWRRSDDGCIWAGGMYPDDVVIYSDTWEERLVHIKKLIDCLGDAHPTINLAKCEFAMVTCRGKSRGTCWEM